ncbi:MAG: TetR/AcrR family transcriptional regulator [Flavobacteriales bacterium]|nr:TetR/AcrR family transcriptional regulator [Flavobacteriales bacterium]NCQ11604.1 TetR/AcrR family transcriptional regulator [Bacteroidota bacterium]
MTTITHQSISDRQLEIIEAAGKILSASGVSGLTIKNLAKEMKFSEAALYRHFSSREEIILALLNYLASSISERVEYSISVYEHPQDKFKALFRNQLQFFNENPHFVVAVFSDGLMEETNRINEAISRLLSNKMAVLMPILMLGQQSGTFTNAITTEELMHVVMGAFRLFMFKWRLAHFEFDLVRHGDNMIESLLTLIRTKSS